MKDISEILTVDQVCDLKSTRKDDVLVELCGLVSAAPEVTDPSAFLRAIRARETVMSTGIGMGVAIPHVKISSVTDFIMAVGRSRQGIEFDSLDGLPAHIVILMGSSDTQAADFLKLIARVGGLFTRTGFKERFLDAATSAEMYFLLTDTC